MMHREKILTLLTSQPNARAGEVSGLIGLSAPGTRKVLKQMVAEGLIEAHGERKSRYYSLPHWSAEDS